MRKRKTGLFLMSLITRKMSLRVALPFLGIVLLT